MKSLSRMSVVLYFLHVFGAVAGPAESNLLPNGGFEIVHRPAPEMVGAVQSWGGVPVDASTALPARWHWHAQGGRAQMRMAGPESARSGQRAVHVQNPPGVRLVLEMAFIELAPRSPISFGVHARGTGAVTVRVHGVAPEGRQLLGEVALEAGEEWGARRAAR